MKTGNPVLSFRIGGIPDEYFEHLIPIEKESVTAVKVAMLEAMKMPKESRLDFGKKAKDFITKAFTIIFLATIVIWFLQTFDVRLNVVTDSKDSLLALIGGLIAPVFAPLGFNDWRISTALITGFTAKESVVSTLTVLLGGDTALLGTMFSTKTALVFLVFTLLYTPCVAAIASVRREMGTKKAAFMVAAIQCLIAWSVAFLVHLVLKLI